MEYTGIKHIKWVDVIGYEGIYKISEFGDILRYDGFKFKRRGCSGTQRYINFSLTKNGIPKTFTLHRLLAIHFIPNPENKPQVNHKDGNKLNNDLSNLEWSTVSDNIKHAWENNLLVRTEKMKEVTRKMQELQETIILDQQTGIFYNSKEAAEIYGCVPDSVNRIMRGERKNKYGFVRV